MYHQSYSLVRVLLAVFLLGVTTTALADRGLLSDKDYNKVKKGMTFEEIDEMVGGDVKTTDLGNGRKSVTWDASGNKNNQTYLTVYFDSKGRAVAKSYSDKDHNDNQKDYQAEAEVLDKEAWDREFGDEFEVTQSKNLKTSSTTKGNQKTIARKAKAPAGGGGNIDTGPASPVGSSPV